VSEASESCFRERSDNAEDGLASAAWFHASEHHGEEEFEHLAQSKTRLAKVVARANRGLQKAKSRGMTASGVHTSIQESFKDAGFDHEAASFHQGSTVQGGQSSNAVKASRDTELIKVVKQGKLDLVRQELKKNPNSVNMKDGFEQPAIFWAVGGGHMDIIRILLKARAQPQVANKSGYTPFMRALHYGNLEAAKVLLNAEADLTAVDNFQGTPLLIAAGAGEADSVKWLLGQVGKKSRWHSTPDIAGRLPLIQAAKTGHNEICQLLLEAAANADCYDNEGRGPLLFALAQHNLDLTEQLLRRGADVNAVDASGCSLLCGLVKEFVRLSTMQQNGEVDADASAALLCGVGTALERKAYPDEKDNKGSTPLLLAGQSNHQVACVLLVANGASTFAHDAKERPVISVVKRAGLSEVVKVFEELTFEQEAMSSNSNNVNLLRASYYGHHDACKKLLQNNADCMYRTKQGQMIVDIASRLGHAEVMKELRHAMAEIAAQEKQDQAKPDAASVKRILMQFEKLSALAQRSQEMLRKGEPNEAVKFLLEVKDFRLSVTNDLLSTRILQEYAQLRCNLIINQGRSSLSQYRINERHKRLEILVEGIRSWLGARKIDVPALQKLVTVGSSYVFSVSSSQFEKEDRYAGILEELQLQAIEPTLERTTNAYIFIKEEDTAMTVFPAENDTYKIKKLQCPFCLRDNDTPKRLEEHSRNCKSTIGANARREWEQQRSRSAESACRRLQDAADLFQSRITDIRTVLEELHIQRKTCQKEAPEAIRVVRSCITLLQCISRLFEERIDTANQAAIDGEAKWFPGKLTMKPIISM
jgi:ankyrin repeat protein